MKTKLLILALLYALTSCKKGENEQRTSSKNEISNTLQDSSSVSVSDSLAMGYKQMKAKATSFDGLQTLNFENFKVVLNKLEQNKIPLPSVFKNSNFLDKSTGTGEDIDLIIGKIVKLQSKSENSSVYENAHVNVRKANLNLKLRVDPDPLVYEQTFDNKYSAALNVIFGDITTDKKYAYTFQLIKVSNVLISNDDLDKEKLREALSNFSKDDYKNLYVIMGATNWYLRANQYQESNLKGNFTYAIKVEGGTYAKTTTKSSDYKIGIDVAPVSNFIKLPSNYFVRKIVQTRN